CRSPGGTTTTAASRSRSLSARWHTRASPAGSGAGRDSSLALLGPGDAFQRGRRVRSALPRLVLRRERQRAGGEGAAVCAGDRQAEARPLTRAAPAVQAAAVEFCVLEGDSQS